MILPSSEMLQVKLNKSLKNGFEFVLCPLGLILCNDVRKRRSLYIYLSYIF